MRAVLPGQPEASLQAVSTGYWDGRRIIVYITGNALAILSDPDTIHQTIYDNDERRLEAVAFDESSGKIAACTGATVRVYRPLGHGDDSLKWALQASFEVGEGSTPATLSWGSSEELLVGRSSLWLYDTTTTPPVCHWQQTLSSPAKAANLSYDSSYIASIGYYDRLVKVWRRLTFSSSEVLFDLSYLPHPRAITSIHWRKPFHVDQTIDNVLYTFCADKVLRVWTGADGPGCQPFNLWGKLDIAAAIQDEQEDERNQLRWAFIIGQRDIAHATERAVQEKGDDEEKEDVALQYLLSIANRDTELCVIFDGRGIMSAWALEIVGSKAKANNVDNVAYVRSKDFEFLKTSTAGEVPPHVEIIGYCNKNTSNLHVLFHHFDGKVEVFESNIADLLDPTSPPNRLVPRATWSGHSASIKKIVRNFSGRAIVSRNEKGEAIIWRHTAGSRQTKLVRHNVISEERHIHRICLLRGGRFVVFLHHSNITLWDCTTSKHTLLADCKFDVVGKPLCVLVLPRLRADLQSVAHIATITSERRGIVWELQLPMKNANGAKPEVNGHEEHLREFCTFTLDEAGDLAYVLPVDPAGSTPVVTGFLDVFARDVAISYTHDGRVEFWTARVDPQQNRVEWLSTSSMETGVTEPALVSGSTMKKAALVNRNRSEVTIWDIRGARAEYGQDFEGHNTVQDLDWTSTPDAQSILAVGFPYRVVLLAQMRFDYLNKGPAWAPVREIAIRDFTPHPIGDSTWLGDGNLVIGAGNQLFLYDRALETTAQAAGAGAGDNHQQRLVSGGMGIRVPPGGVRDLFDVVQKLNGPLPVFHPQFLSQCILAGKTAVVQRVLLALNRVLRFHVEGDVIDDYLGLDPEEFYVRDETSATANGRSDPSYLTSGPSFNSDSSNADEAFTEATALAICEKLQNVTLPQLSGHEQIQLVALTECAGVVEGQRRSLDENGARFTHFFRQHALRRGRTAGATAQMSWREICWAYHSTSQDVLAGFVARQYHGAASMLWGDARESGVFMWLTDAAAVKAQFEIVARNEYTKSELKDPVDCSLFYLALKKKAVLRGLWRMATWNKEQAATQRLLGNNFEDPKWRTTALKNAYALLSKRRFHYAAAFFLLADHLQDAVNVCLNQIKDLQLAIAIARVYEDDSGGAGPVLRRLLENEVLALAAQEGNRWLASWAFWMLKRRDMAVRALITPVYTLLETPVSTGLKAKLFLTDDPALVVLYSQLRQKTLQTLRGASKVTPRVEWEFVIHNARLYDRMGCDLLGLDLVRNWEFLRHVPSSTAPELGGEIDPRNLLKRRSSLIIQDLPLSPAAPGDMKTGGHAVKAPPSVFEEPDANSLLDNFGF
ncbi:regulator of V-ATPase in vacuolar membrane protein [Whalleya microplaca]|nr:regulator of V-ATPase in vacuolar membrane protein [Whalleya microplaca]